MYFLTGIPPMLNSQNINIIPTSYFNHAPLDKFTVNVSSEIMSCRVVLLEYIAKTFVNELSTLFIESLRI